MFFVLFLSFVSFWLVLFVLFCCLFFEHISIGRFMAFGLVYRLVVPVFLVEWRMILDFLLDFLNLSEVSNLVI